jgi:NTE family protein
MRVGACDDPRVTDRDGVAFVLGGGGVLGAAEVGMLRALADAGILPDLVVGTSIGAINGAVVAADPKVAVGRLAALWEDLASSPAFGPAVRRLATFVRSGTHLQTPEPLRDVLTRHLPVQNFEELAVPFQCVAASIERAAEHWFTSGPLVDAVLASSAVPGVFPPVNIGGEHYFDGGLVNSLPVGRAVELGARRIFVLHVGRIEQPLQAPRRPWDVALVAFEVARRHRFTRDLAAAPPGVEVHVLPTGMASTPIANVRYRDFTAAATRIERAHAATADYLAAHEITGG